MNYYKEALKQLDFLNYKTFDDVNRFYSNFIQKIMTIINKIASYKNKSVQGNTQNWFDNKVLEKFNVRGKLFKKIKKFRLVIDRELYKKAKHDTSKLT